MTWCERHDTVLFLSVLTACLALAINKLVPGTMLSAILLSAGVIVFGLPHGSLDVLVAKRVFALNSSGASAIFLTGYTALSAMYGCIWWRYPVPALAAFLIISAFHFSSDWEQRGIFLTRLAYGSAVVTLPVIGHAREVRQIYGVLDVDAPEKLLMTAKIIALPACLLALVAATRQGRRRVRDFVELAGLFSAALFFRPCSTSSAISASCTVHVTCHNSQRRALDKPRSGGATDSSADSRGKCGRLTVLDGSFAGDHIEQAGSDHLHRAGGFDRSAYALESDNPLQQERAGDPLHIALAITITGS